VGTGKPLHSLYLERIDLESVLISRNGTIEGKFETVSGYCQSTVFAAAQPGCMAISTSLSLSPYSLTPLTCNK
jgi:hypothetical protein